MSGGQKISDHGFWAGKGGKDSPFPMGNHTKSESSAEGAGGLMTYEDTTDKIHGTQEATKGKLKGHPLKAGYRN